MPFDNLRDALGRSPWRWWLRLYVAVLFALVAMYCTDLGPAGLWYFAFLVLCFPMSLAGLLLYLSTAVFVFGFESTRDDFAVRAWLATVWCAAAVVQVWLVAAVIGDRRGPTR